MTADSQIDARIVNSWHTNAEAWTRAVRAERIASRVLVTNGAVIDAVMRRAPATVLDIGCGEGWLVRALDARGVRGIGVDVVPGLVDRARAAGSGDFRVASYESIAAGELDVAVDVAVANFSLIGGEAVAGLVRRVPRLLRPRGAFVIQTLHPLLATGDAPYRDGWREGSWAGFDDDFIDPAPWYFRTLESWVALLTTSGLRVVELREPLHPTTRKPASVVLVAEAGSSASAPSLL